jgi:hypothetical protein
MRHRGAYGVSVRNHVFAAFSVIRNAGDEEADSGTLTPIYGESCSMRGAPVDRAECDLGARHGVEWAGHRGGDDSANPNDGIP